jgi:alginate O-acetyltransferase complex protein AlgI
MLFNSMGFLFAFLPLTLAVFAVAVCWRSSTAAVAALLAASYGFYAWWEPGWALLLAASTAFNWTLGLAILRSRQRSRGSAPRWLLGAGVTINICLLAYFKYSGFLISTFDAATGAAVPVPTVALPAGISFYTFTQIAFLVDSACRPATPVRATEYALFVSYFPHLVAGPIIHHRETVPQFRRMAVAGWDSVAVAVGLSIFAIGLLKKILLADSVAPFADAAFSRLAGEPLRLVDSWTGALAYTFQIYFDFSGYSDMAIGLSLLFGVRLPLNFASPYRATSMIEFWSRWHMSLSRFLRDYVYIPLGGNRRGPTRRHLNLMATMLVGGLWHGGGWTFIAWGGLHGILLVVNHLWRSLRGSPTRARPWWTIWLQRAVVLTCVTVGWVLFRADSLAAAATMLAGLGGAHGLGIDAGNATALGLIAACLVIVWGLPNTYELFARHHPALRPERPPALLQASAPAWRMNGLCAAAAGAALAACVLAIHGPSPFLYFRF